MSTSITQHNETGRLAGEIRRSVHAQIFSLGQPPREVSRRYGMSDREVVQIAIEVERQCEERRLRAAFADGRRSLLTQYARKAVVN
jgi:hypothetical protein